MIRTLRLVNRNLIVVNSQTIALCITVREQPSLKHFIRRETNAGNNVGRVESSLLYIHKIVLRVSVQLKFSYRNQREIFFRPYFGKIKRMEAIGFGLLFGHDLNIHRSEEHTSELQS